MREELDRMQNEIAALRERFAYHNKELQMDLLYLRLQLEDLNHVKIPALEAQLEADDA